MVMGALERLDPPRVLGELTLLAALGEGGMATVYLAGVGSGPLARMCAVKLLRANLPDHDYMTRFLDEARLVVRLHHNNIVDVRAAGEIDGQLYIAMEAIEGRDLADVWDRCAEVGRAFPVPLAVHTCREVLRGLHYAHTFPGLGLVHRDVSPSNVLIDWAGAIRLADFGLATSSLKASLTLPGVVFGKVGYMSPEQARHEPLDGRADVYAVAAILWELLTGRPLRSPDGMSTDSVSRFEAPPPSSRSRRVDAHLDEIVAKGLERHRDKRWDSAQAMMLALNQWLADHSPEMGQEMVSDFMRKLFGNAREVESSSRAELLRELTSSHRAASGTQILEDSGQTETAPRDSRGSARLGAAAPGLDAKELIDAGTVIADRYRVLSRLGRGGMGYVYLGEHVTVGRSVAIKVLTHDWSRTTSVAQRFRAEARAASAAGHPNIVEVFDAGELADGRLYLVMEFLTGRNLFEEVQTVGPMAVARSCHIMRDVGRAIRAAHEVGVIHRDLKPDNVMLVDRGRDEGELVKVLDFGISSSAERSAGEQRLTNVGQALGTPEYMAPEQAKGHQADELFDIYALGVMFFELLTGDPPFHGTNVFEIVTRKTSEAAPSIGSKRDDLPDDLISLVDDCLAVEPERRPKTAQLFLARLEDVLRRLPRESGATKIAFEASLTRGLAPKVTPKPTPPDPNDATDEIERIPPPVAEPRPPVVVEPPTPPIYYVLLVGVVLVIILGLWVAFTGKGGGPDTETETTDSAVAVDAGDDATKVDPDAGEVVAPLDVGDAATGTETGAGTETGTETGAETGDETGTETGEVQAPSIAKHETAECKRVRDDAEAAAKAFKWDAVLGLTGQRKCWSKSQRNDNIKLEVEALMESERWEKCVKAGRNHPSGKVKGWVNICKGHL
ncbi:Serine/threonine protein kinase PrkC, regulator of stationary phase [Enhygromyxa salina]|uniref:Serine/threonine protein kinase PrkC, regulator of stationary phase n=1 Tax=Enhygromyxa salina TaxID=215803 RepID=A0A0C1Z4L2_9BACT|nr:serine/threonine-protein kinase [Enhygromyxa salina]KIG12604.1 Serine/threonine protein kinase PrkC, regulator of stationary phase [Enhygromyxa salina]